MPPSLLSKIHVMTGTHIRRMTYDGAFAHLIATASKELGDCQRLRDIPFYWSIYLKMT
jgi:hypothetical protein